MMLGLEARVRIETGLGLLPVLFLAALFGDAVRTPSALTVLRLASLRFLADVSETELIPQGAFSSLFVLCRFVVLPSRTWNCRNERA